MSEVLHDFAEPLLDGAEDEESIKLAILIAALIWNAALLHEKDRDKIVEEIVTKLGPPDGPMDFAESLSIVEMMLDRKRKLFPRDNRMILDYECYIVRDEMRLNVVSTLNP